MAPKRSSARPCATFHGTASCCRPRRRCREPDDPDPAGTIRSGLDASLKRLGTDYVDIYHLHGVGAAGYDFAANVLAPVVTGLKEAGKIRAVGITEEFPANPRHEMLQRGLHDPWWDVVMVGFNLLNPSARRSVFPRTLEKGVGTLVMFAVRRALSQPAQLEKLLREMEQRAILEPGADLGFLTENGCAETLAEAAYRFCVHEPGRRRGLDGDRRRGSPRGEHRGGAQAAASGGGVGTARSAVRQRGLGHRQLNTTAVHRRPTPPGFPLSRE